MVYKRKKKRRKAVKADLDLNKDGKLDAKDKTIAAKTLATDFEDVPKEEEAPPAKAEKEPVKDVSKDGRIAKRDISMKWRKGDFVPESQIMLWEQMGINWKVWFE